jgi:hypothetical protein
MTDDGDTKDDVPLPDNEVGQKITKLFKEEEKDTSKLLLWSLFDELPNHASQTLLFSPPWARSAPWKPRRPPTRVKSPSL